MNNNAERPKAPIWLLWLKCYL